MNYEYSCTMGKSSIILFCIINDGYQQNLIVLFCYSLGFVLKQAFQLIYDNFCQWRWIQTWAGSIAMLYKWITKTGDALMKIFLALSTFKSYKKGKTEVQVCKIAHGLCYLADNLFHAARVTSSKNYKISHYFMPLCLYQLLFTVKCTSYVRA